MRPSRSGNGLTSIYTAAWVSGGPRTTPGTGSRSHANHERDDGQLSTGTGAAACPLCLARSPLAVALERSYPRIRRSANYPAAQPRERNKIRKADSHFNRERSRRLPNHARLLARIRTLNLLCASTICNVKSEISNQVKGGGSGRSTFRFAAGIDVILILYVRFQSKRL